jgi:hypothetical protein
MLEIQEGKMLVAQKVDKESLSSKEEILVLQTAQDNSQTEVFETRKEMYQT